MLFRSSAPEKALAELFQTHPYRWTPIGSIPHLRSAHVREVRDFWTRYYVPCNATLVIVGAVGHDDAQALARKYFEWIPKFDEPGRVTAREPMPTESRTVTLKEDNAPAPVVAAVYHTVPLTHGDSAPLELLASIMGGGDSSRLYRELVAERKLAVAAMAMPVNLEQNGLFALEAVMSPLSADAKEVMTTLGKHIKRVSEEPVSEGELLKARNQAIRGLVTENLTVQSKASALGSYAVLYGDTARVNERLEEYRRVTEADLQRVANTYFGPGRAIKISIDRNLLGTIFCGKKEEDAPVTAEREETAPPPGRPGTTRPDSFGKTPPVAGMLDFDTKIDSAARTLSNGLKVIVVPNHEVPYVTMWLGMKTGAWAETKPGAASLAMSMLTKGTARHSEAELSEELDTWAISLGGSAGLDSSSVSASCLTEHRDRTMSLLGEVVRTPSFPADEFEKLRQQVLTGLAVQNAQPQYLAERELRRRLYGDHPYARTASGEVADVSALKLEDLTAWYQRFARPDVSTLVVAGDVEPDAVFGLADSTLGDWTAEGPTPTANLQRPPAPADTHIYVIDMSGTQCQIRVGQLGITRQHPGYFTSRVVTQYFGGAFKSRLNEKIRVEKGLTYGAGGGYGAQRFLGQFTASTFSKVPSTGETLQIILDEVKRLQSDPPNERELGDTKLYTLGNFASDRETPTQVAAQLWSLELHDLSADYYDRFLAAVSKTEADDCVKLAQQTVDPSKLTIVVVGPAAQLKDDLERIAPVTVVKREAE